MWHIISYVGTILFLTGCGLMIVGGIGDWFTRQ